MIIHYELKTGRTLCGKEIDKEKLKTTKQWHKVTCMKCLGAA